MTYDPHGRRLLPTTPRPLTASVVRVDESGVWAAPLDGDTRHPLGPCYGAQGCAVDDVVLLIDTDHGPWVAGRDAS